MKTKFSRILGVALPFAMVLALAITLIPGSTPAAEADVGTLKYDTISLPKIGSAGKYIITPAANNGPIAVAAGGSTLFAATNAISGSSANISDLLKSSDAGLTWSSKANFRTTAGSSDTTPIVGIVVSPEYAADATLFVATETTVYQSVDGATSFSAMTSGWGSENITDIDTTLDSSGRVSLIVATTTGSTAGDVYVYSPATTGMSWKTQRIDGSTAGSATKTLDVLAVAFSPNFSNDEAILAVSTNGTSTKLQIAFGSTKDGGGWGSAVGASVFKDTTGTTVVDMAATRARIAFPDDFDVDSITSNIAFVGLVAGTTDGTTSEKGDAYKATFGQSTSEINAVDLDVRGTVGLTRTATNIWSVAASGDAEAASVVVGTNFWSTGAASGTYYWTAYYSNDSGTTWSSAREKSPTGAATGAGSSAAGAKVEVVMAADFATSGVAYAATQGSTTSALNRTVNGGTSWNQISLIDYADTTTYYKVRSIKPNAVYSGTPDIYMVTERTSATVDLVTAYTTDTSYSTDFFTYAINGALWYTANGGANWERIFSYANPTATDSINSVSVHGDTVFAKDYYVGKIWRSLDKGATFPRVIPLKNGTRGSNALLVSASTSDEKTILTYDYLGNIWWTSNLGRPWVKPQTNAVSGKSVNEIIRSGDLWLISTVPFPLYAATGIVYISTDGGTTISDTVGVTDVGGWYIGLAFDNNFADNNYVYASIGNIWRIELDQADADSTSWKQIDNKGSTTGDTTASIFTGFQLVGDTFYGWDGAAVNATANTGGLWRSVNPADSTTGLYPVEFQKTQSGLSSTIGAEGTLSYLGWSVYPNTVWARANDYDNTANYYKQIIAFADILGDQVSLLEPADGATDEGISLSTVDLTLTELLTWEATTRASTYRYHLANDADFKSMVTNGNSTTSGQQVAISGLMPGKTYYWRIRVETPLYTPWSETRSFTIAEGVAAEVVEEPEPEMAGVTILAPASGSTGVSTLPTFVWSEDPGAEGYEIVVGEDQSFAIIDWSRTAANAFYKAEEPLAYDTTYYWRVRAAPEGEWALGVFDTEAAPVEPVAEEPTIIVQEKPAPPAEVLEVQVPAAIPDWTLYTIIIIGGVLVIALIVLIVRTRRVA